MNMIPAPGRIFKQWSTIILLFAGIGDLAHVLLASLADLHYLTATQLGLFNAVLAFAAGAAKLVQQNIALTEEQKVDMIAAVESAPTKAAPAVGFVPTAPMPAPAHLSLEETDAILKAAQILKDKQP